MSEAAARDSVKELQSMLTSASPTADAAAKRPSSGGERGQSQLALGPPPPEQMRKTTMVNGEGELASSPRGLRWAGLSACCAARECNLTSSLLDRKETAQMKRLQKAVNWRDCRGSNSIAPTRASGMLAAVRMAFASSVLLLPSSPSALTSLRARTGASVSFLALPPSPSAAARSSRNLALFCSSSSPPPADAAVAPPPTQAAEEETKPAAPGGEKAEPTVEELAGLLDIRVGRVVKAWRHPEADTLYVEEVDVGEAEPRTICSGLVNFLPIEELQDSSVIVLANLKPRNMRGIKSNGMLMAASDDSHENVELLTPPEGSVPGERVWFGSEEEKDRQSDPASPNQIQKKKIWESVQPHLKTTDNCVAVLGEHPMRTSAGSVFCKSLQGARVS